MRSRPEDIVDDLRESAADDAALIGCALAETMGWKAADLIEWLVAALERVGGPSALDPWYDTGEPELPNPPPDDEARIWAQQHIEALIASRRPAPGNTDN